MYIGYTNNLKRRIAQHVSKPPRRMLADVKRLGGFRSNFEVEAVHENLRESEAKILESSMIEDLGTRSNKGYNVLESNPGRSRLYWWLKRHKKNKQ